MREKYKICTVFDDCQSKGEKVRNEIEFFSGLNLISRVSGLNLIKRLHLSLD